jgi:hypothetical protein
MSFDSLLKKYKPEKIDLLHTDTEGFDFELIKLIPFATLKPQMILYEHQHLTPEDAKACTSLLENNGYTLLVLPEGDTFAYQTSL